MSDRLRFAALLFLACTSSTTQDHRSTQWPTSAERIADLCDFTLCPTRPLDAAFHIFKTDDGTVIHAIVKVDPNDIPRWSMGCENRTLEARPAWVKDVLPKDWKLTTAPDTWRCGTEKRVIHVKEALIVRSVLRTE